MNEIIPSKKIVQLFFLSILFLLIVLTITNLIAYLTALLGAIIFYVLMRTPLKKLTEQYHWKTIWATLLLLLVSLLIVTLPIFLLFNMVYAKVIYALQNSDSIVQTVQQTMALIEQKTGLKLIDTKNLSNVLSNAWKNVPVLLGSTVGVLTNLIMMYFMLYFMLSNHRTMEQWLYTHCPMKKPNLKMFAQKMYELVLANALGVPVIAILQGTVAVLAYWVLGVENIGFWYLLTIITCFIPIVGSALSFVPVAIIFFAHNEPTKAFIMLIYGFAVVGMTDSLFRIVAKKKLGNLHPIVSVLGVILGVNVFGFVGIIYGPIIIEMLILLVRIYIDEYVTNPC